jgi:NAD(P)-dependent dehydrogenase (short-subunit alcohol dehydrogenase family)
VTGGTQGIGWATVQALAAHGGEVYGCGLSTRSLERAEAERDSLPQRDAIHLVQCDITDRERYQRWLAEIHHQTGQLDVLVNNAAYVRWSDVEKMSIEEAQQTMRVAYDGLVYGIKKVLPYMKAAGRGHIINVGSITGNIYVGGASAAYSAAKAAVEAYTRILQVELKETPIHVSLIRLGTVAGTDFFREHVPHTRMPRLLDFLPYATPPQVAQIILRALYRRQEIVTYPRYLGVLRLVFLIAPGFSRWLAALGGAGKREYASAKWREE